MEKHILIEKAKTYTPQNKEGEPIGYEYDKKKGYTASILGGSPFITSEHAQHLNTKKEDVETGEDQKGE